MDEIAVTMTQEVFWIANWQVNPSTCRIKSDFTEIKLEPKVMAVLLVLARHAGQVLSRDQIETMVWQDMVVGYDSLASSINKLRKAFGDNSKNPKFIETVPKRGYRLIAEYKIATQSLNHDVEQLTKNPIKAGRDDSFLANKFSFITIVIICVFVFVLWLVPEQVNEPMKSQSGKPIIAVLPFQNLSNDKTQDYFSDGMTADIITDLSKISSIAVIAQNSVFAYREPQDVRQLGKDLGVTHIVEGSVQKAGITIRISARLVDTRSGFNLWTDRFDGKLNHIFKLQDEVTQKVVSSLEISLTESERQKVAQLYTKSIEAYDEFLKGWQSFWFMSQEANHRARDHFNKALELDDNFARAYANLALTYAYDYLNAWHPEPSYSMRQAKYFSKKAVLFDPSIPQVHWVESLTFMFVNTKRLCRTITTKGK